MNNILVSNLRDHLLIKEKMIDLINKVPTDFFDNKGNKVLTDYDSEENFEYKKKIIPHFIHQIEYVLSLDKDLYVDPIKLWFQKYKKSYFHNWHTHHQVNFGLVYFLKLSNSNFKTEFKKLDGKIIDYDCREGDVILFPAYIPHRAPIVDVDDEEKIMIGLNFDILVKE